MQMYLIRISIIVCCFQLEFLVVYSGSCREERSQRGFALLNTTYGSKPVQRYPDCLDSCLTDPKCMSFNFWWDSRKCDLNTKVREHSCGACFLKDASSTYMGMARYPGYPGKNTFITTKVSIHPLRIVTVSTTMHPRYRW